MNFEVKSIEPFERQAYRLIKKYPSLRFEIFNLIQQLKIAPIQGLSLGNKCYKIRISIASKNSGKTGGARIITYVVQKNQIVYLLSIYDKSEHANITNNEIRDLLKQIP